MKNQVALLAEGGDRNFLRPFAGRPAVGSPSSQRAWIEMPMARISAVISFVALLAEGVDRNSLRSRCGRPDRRSPSSQRAWIEIRSTCKEAPTWQSRPPRRGRG